MRPKFIPRNLMVHTFSQNVKALPSFKGIIIIIISNISTLKQQTYYSLKMTNQDFKLWSRIYITILDFVKNCGHVSDLLITKTRFMHSITICPPSNFSAMNLQRFYSKFLNSTYLFVACAFRNIRRMCTPNTC